MLQIDHVIALVPDLDDAAADLWDRFGRASVVGGRHAGHGTGNRIVPLGDTYLELMAVVDPGEAKGSPLGRWAAANTPSGGISPQALCLRTDDISPIAARLGEHPEPMSRIKPDGTRLGWRLAGLSGMLDHGLPFFIEWEPGSHPAATPVTHRFDRIEISQVTIGQPGTLRDLIESVEGLSIGEGRGVLSVTLEIPDRSFTLD